MVDVRDHRNRRKQFQKRSIALVRLGHHQLAAAEPRVAAECAQPAADHRGRVEPGPFEHERDHRRRRRLAVRARDRDRVAQPHQLREHLGARDHRNLPAYRFDDLGVPGAHRRRDHHHVRIADVLGGVPDGDPHAQRRKPSVTGDRLSSDPVTTYPRLASSSAMPLIPMPPIPMKCTRRVFPSTGLSRRVHKDPASVADQRQRAIDDHPRGVGPRQRARRRGHPLPRRAVAHQPVNPLRQHGAGRI